MWYRVNENVVVNSDHVISFWSDGKLHYLKTTDEVTHRVDMVEEMKSNPAIWKLLHKEAGQ